MAGIPSSLHSIYGTQEHGWWATCMRKLKWPPCGSETSQAQMKDRFTARCLLVRTLNSFNYRFPKDIIRPSTI